MLTMRMSASGVKRTSLSPSPMSANDPKRTLDPRHRLSAQGFFLNGPNASSTHGSSPRTTAAFRYCASLAKRFRSPSAKPRILGLGQPIRNTREGLTPSLVAHQNNRRSGCPTNRCRSDSKFSGTNGPGPELIAELQRNRLRVMRPGRMIHDGVVAPGKTRPDCVRQSFDCLPSFVSFVSKCPARRVADLARRVSAHAAAHAYHSVLSSPVT